MASAPVPHRQSLVSQAVRYLTAEIERGRWREWLPGERDLAEALLMSRNTLRLALRRMKREGTIRSVVGTGNQVVARPAGGGPRPAAREVAILLPVPFEQLRPTHALVLKELRSRLEERDCRLHEIVGEQYFRASPGAALQKLTKLRPHACWVLGLSNFSQQRWFMRNRVPCVVDGSAFPDIDLPSVDLDHRAMGRHAAGMLLRLGHRRIIYLSHRRPRAGDIDSEQGFLSGVADSSHRDARAAVLRYENSVASLSHLLNRLMKEADRPTALLVVNSYFYLTVASWLTQRGWRIPQDISVLSRDQDPFLSFVVPRPASYAMPPHISARHMSESILEWLEAGRGNSRAIRLMPDFIAGESVGPAPARP